VLLNKIGKFNGLIERNCRRKTSEREVFPFPFIIIATSENAVQDMTVNVNTNNTSVCIGIGQKFQILSDRDSLPYINVKKSKCNYPKDLETYLKLN
jgi:hypothetical protein